MPVTAHRQLRAPVRSERTPPPSLAPAAYALPRLVGPQARNAAHPEPPDLGLVAVGDEALDEPLRNSPAISVSALAIQTAGAGLPPVATPRRPPLQVPAYGRAASRARS